MKVVYPHEEREAIAFAERAAEWFAGGVKRRTYTDDRGIQGGCLFAVRWGVADQAVLVFKLDEYFEPRIYGNMVPEVEE
jgi:hypothetical protein